jgi:hypothetical protein
LRLHQVYDSVLNFQHRFASRDACPAPKRIEALPLRILLEIVERRAGPIAEIDLGNFFGDLNRKIELAGEI